MMSKFHASNTSLDIQDLSGIFGSISIACWIVVYTPQIFTNFRRSSTNGLSIFFVIVWLLGDVFNVLGAVMQGVQPHMTILAIYYTFADTVLLGQCFYYRGFTLSDDPCRSLPLPAEDTTVEDDVSEDSPLLWRESRTHRRYQSRSSVSSFNTDFNRTSLALPLVDSNSPSQYLPEPSTIRAIFGNTLALLLTCIAGVMGWYVSQHHHSASTSPTTSLTPPIALNPGGQIFGYLCAALYIGSRIPQLLLNYRRKSTDGISILFFTFTCAGNITYLLGIFAYEPGCAGIAGGAYTGQACRKGEWRHGYAMYVLANASWVVGSAVTLLLDLVIFGQFYRYRGNKELGS